MSAREKSDLPEVARKRANKAASAAAEPVERRGGAKENAELQSTVRTQSREAVSRAQARIREAVIRNKQDKLTALLHHINIDVLRASFFGLKKTAAPGVDEMTWTEYAEHLEASLVSLHARVHTGAYRALPSRRKYIPKADGRQRPLGIAALAPPVWCTSAAQRDWCCRTARKTVRIARDRATSLGEPWSCMSQTSVRRFVACGRALLTQATMQAV